MDLLSALGGAIIGAIVTILIWFATGHRDRQVRKEGRAEVKKDRREDRAAELERRQEERAYADRLRVFEREQERLGEQRREGRQQARALLEHCEDLLRDWDRQTSTRTTYSWNRTWTRRHEHLSRLLPDAEFRIYLLAAVRVVNETWVVDSVGELDVAGTVAQRKTLLAMRDQLTTYASDNSWDRSRLVEANSAQAVIDDMWQTYHAN